MEIKDTARNMSFKGPSQDEHKLLIDFFALLLEWEIEDEQKSNDKKEQKIQTPV